MPGVPLLVAAYKPMPRVRPSPVVPGTPRPSLMDASRMVLDTAKTLATQLLALSWRAPADIRSAKGVEPMLSIVISAEACRTSKTVMATSEEVASKDFRSQDIGK